MTTLPSLSLKRRAGRLRLGYVALTDAAPLIVAEARGLFAAHGVEVELHRELGWATVRDKIIYGELDAAHAPAPMLWAAHLGIACPATEVLTALVLNLHGNAVTLSRRLWDTGVRDDSTLRTIVRDRRARQTLTFGVVFPFSSHHLMLREWLQRAGIDPDRDVRIVVVPPAQMFRNLAAGTIDGFCAGEPWNSLAIKEGAGWCRLCSAQEQPGHAEKVLMVTRTFAEKRANEHGRLVAALLEACVWCDEPQNREPLAELLGQPRYLNMPASVIAPALVGQFDRGTGAADSIPDFHIFHRGDANVPSLSKADALHNALLRAGLLTIEGANPSLPRHLFREDLHREILTQHAHNALVSSSDLRGVPGS